MRKKVLIKVKEIGSLEDPVEDDEEIFDSRKI